VTTLTRTHPAGYFRPAVSLTSLETTNLSSPLTLIPAGTPSRGAGIRVTPADIDHTTTPSEYHGMSAAIVEVLDGIHAGTYHVAYCGGFADAQPNLRALPNSLHDVQGRSVTQQWRDYLSRYCVTSCVIARAD
jgi:hypothetical protein